MNKADAERLNILRMTPLYLWYIGQTRSPYSTEWNNHTLMFSIIMKTQCGDVVQHMCLAFIVNDALLDFLGKQERRKPPLIIQISSIPFLLKLQQASMPSKLKAK